MRKRYGMQVMFSFQIFFFRTRKQKEDRGWDSGKYVAHMLMSLGKCNQLTTSIYYLR